MSSYYNITAFNIKIAPFAESDKLITLFSFELGKIKALAKGSRKVSSKLAGRLEPFILNQLLLVKGKTFFHIISAETLRSFLKIRESFEKLNLAFYFSWLVDRVTVEGQINKGLYHLLSQFFLKLDSTSQLINIKDDFEKEILKAEGILDHKMKNLREHLEDYAGVVLPNV